MSIRFARDFVASIFRCMMFHAVNGPVDDFEYPDYPDDLEHPNYLDNSLAESVGRWKFLALVVRNSTADIVRSQVSEIRWYKHLEALEHEYIVVTCRRAGEADIYLRLGRRPLVSEGCIFAIPDQALSQELIEICREISLSATIHLIPWFLFHAFVKTFTDEQLNDFHTDLEAERGITKPGVATRRSTGWRDDLKSGDSVTRVGNPEGFLGEEAKELSRYQNFKRPFYVRDLAFLACAVSEHDADYQPFIPRGYWYPRTLVDTAVAIYQPTSIIPSDHFEAAGTYTVGKWLRPESRRTVQVFMGNNCEEEVDQIKNTVQDSIALHDRQLSPTHPRRHTPPFDQSYHGSQIPPTAPPASPYPPLGPEVDAIMGLIHRITTGPTVINFITINSESGNVSGNTHTNINNAGPRRAHQNARWPDSGSQVDSDGEVE